MGSLLEENIRVFLILLLVMACNEALAFGADSTSSSERTNRSVSMSLAEARKTLIQIWENQKPDSSTYHYDKLTVTFFGKDKVELYMSLISSRAGARSFKYIYNLTEMSNPYIKTKDFWHNFAGYKVEVDQGLKYQSSTGRNEKHNMLPIIFPLGSEAEAFVKALSVLKQYAIKEREILTSEGSSFANFQEKAKTWRALQVKPGLPEEVRRFRLLAEDALNNKEFEKAIEYYEQGLEIEPLWPQGQYNTALLYGELKDYYSAETHMKRYLELVPDAPDAQAARDQIMIWQSKMRQ